MTPIEVILEAGCIATGTTVQQMRKPGRSTVPDMARRYFIATKMREEGYSYPKIGKAFGGRNHSTIWSMLHGGKGKKRP